jgi:PGF-pre-PGF domain-containing protein
MLKRILLVLVFLIVLSTVGFSAACSLGSDYTQEVANSSCDSITTNGYTWDTGGNDLTTAGDITVSNTGVFNASLGGTVDAGGLVIVSGGTCYATSGMTVLGDFDNGGTFVHNEGLVRIDVGTHIQNDQTALNTTFYDLNIFQSGGALWRDIIVVNTFSIRTTENLQLRLGSYAVNLYIGNSTQSGTIDLQGSAELSFQDGNSGSIRASSSDFPANVTVGTVGIDWDDDVGSEVHISDLIFYNNIQTGGSGATVVVDGDCSFAGVNVSSGDVFNISSVANVNFTGDLNYEGNLTLQGNITSISGMVNVTENATLNGDLNASLSTQAIFGRLDIVSGKIYHATNGTTSITVSNLTIGGTFVHNSGILDVLDTIMIDSGNYLVLQNTTTVKAINNSGQVNISDSVSLIFRDQATAGFRESEGSLNSGYHSYLRGITAGVTNKWTINETASSSMNLTYAWIRDGNSTGTSIDAKVNATGVVGLWSFSYSDTDSPTVDFQDPTPSNGVTDYDLSIVINVSYSDDYIDICTLEWDGSNETFASSDSTNFWETKTLSIGNEINYKVYCSDIFGNENATAQRTITGWFSIIRFLNPTFDNETATTNSTVEVNMTIDTSGLQEVKFNWNGTNYTYYDSDLIFMLNFDNVSALGENDTNIVDHSFQPNNLTDGGTSVGIGTGKYGNGLSMNGAIGQNEVNISGYVDDLKLQNTNFTIELWAKPNDITAVSGSVIIGKNLDWQISNQNNKIAFYIGGIRYDGTSSEEFLPGVWTHIVVAYVNTTKETTYYINGNKDRNFTTRAITDDGTDVYIGADSRDGVGQEFDGTIDEVRIWNKTFTDIEIKQHYYSSLNKFTSTDWIFYTNQTISSSGNYTYEGFGINSTFDNTTLNRKMNVTVPTTLSTEPDVSICHLKDCKEAVLIISGDANSYTLYSDHYNASETAGYLYTFDIDTRCYREGGTCGYPAVTRNAPSPVEMREIMWQGHCLDFDGYDHVSESTAGAFIESLTNSSEAFYYNLTGTIVVTGFLPNAGNHRSSSRGDWAYNNASFIYMASRQSSGLNFHNTDLIVPRDANSSYLEHGQNSRDLYDVYKHAQLDYDAGRNYTHIFGHAAAAVYGELYSNLTALNNNMTLRNYYWSASLERAARYVFERNYATVTEIDLSSDPKQIGLNITYPSGLNTSRYGVDIYVMPLTIKMVGASANSYVYENNSGVLTRLYSYTNGTDLFFEAIPKNYTILASTTALQTAADPLVNLTVDIVAVLNTTGDATRDGFAYETIIAGNQTSAKFANWSLSVTNATNLPYIDNFALDVDDMELSLNDRLNSERGKILYYVEDGYTNTSLFTFKGKLTNADGETRYISLGNVNGTITVAFVDNDTLNVSTSLTQQINYTIDQFTASRNYTANTTDSGGTLVSTQNVSTGSSGVATFLLASDSIASVGFYLNDKENGAVCTLSSECGSGVCGLSICRASSVYCGNGVCDTGETSTSCSVDCAVAATTSSGFTQCMDRLDNDGDGLVDMNDPGCSRPGDDSENSEGVVEQVIKEVVDIILENVKKGEQMEINITSDENETTIVKGISIIAGEDAEEGKLEVKEYNTAPEAVKETVRGYKITATRDVQMNKTEEEYTVYQYVEVETDVEIESAVLEFEVSKEWMDIQGAGKDDVMLLHFTNDEWVELETVYLGGDDPLLFEAQTGSFSVFAVGVRAPVVDYPIEWYLLAGGVLVFLGIVGWVLVGKGNKLVRKSRK